jgi:hypothetical protein
MSAYFALAIAALEDLRDDYHQQSNRAFFNSRFVSASDFARHEQTVRNALAILQNLPFTDSISFEDSEPVVSRSSIH